MTELRPAKRNEMLHPSLTSHDALSGLRSRWHERPCLRIAPFLDEKLAEAMVQALRPLPFTLMATVSPSLSFQYFAFSLRPEVSCDHVLCQFGRWLWTDGADWLSAITGMSLGPPADRILQSSLYTKGCYLDVHNDHDGARQLAFVVGLTPANPNTRTDENTTSGGQLEFLTIGSNGIEIVESRPPGWNSLDIFDVRAPDRLHRVPLVTHALERRAISGWLYQRSE